MNTIRIANRLSRIWGSLFTLRLVPLALLLFLGACQSLDIKERPNLPQISFETFRYTLGNGEVTLSLSLEIEADKELHIPFTLAGSARQGVDYSVEDKDFVFPKGERTAQVRIKRLNMQQAGTILLSLSGTAPNGYLYGLKNYTQVELLGSDALIYTFVKSEEVLPYEKTYEISVTKVTGENHRHTTKTKYALEVDPSSTAILGKHFEFVDEASAVVPNKRNVGTFKLRFLSLEAGHEDIILRLADREGYARGVHPTLRIRITGPESFSGSWEVLKVANRDWINTSYGDFGVNADTFVNFAEGDYIELEGSSYESYTLRPHFTGLLKNYFNQTTTATFVGAVDKLLNEVNGRPPTINLTKLQLGAVNLRFSSTEQKISKANIGLRYLDTEDNGRVLEMTIDEYEPLQNGWKDVYDFSGNMIDLPIRLYFRKRQ